MTEEQRAKFEAIPITSGYPAACAPKAAATDFGTGNDFGTLANPIYGPNPPDKYYDKTKHRWVDINTTNYRMGWRRSPVLYWGKINNYPQLLTEAMHRNNVLEAALNVQADLFIGRGLFMYKEVFENGQRRVEEIEMPDEIREAFIASNIDQYIDIATRELLRYGNIFPMYWLNKERQIAEIRIFDTVFGRVERPDPENGRINNCYFSAQWGKNNFVVSTTEIVDDLKQWVQKYPRLDDYDPAWQMQLMPDIFEFVHHIKLHTSGHHYGRAPWHAAYENGWINISSAVPEMKASMMRNAMAIPYVVYIHKKYWESVYTADGWASFSMADRQAKIKLKQEEIENYLLGRENMGKVIFSSMDTDGDGNIIKTIEIDVLDNKFKDGPFIPDSQVADGQILFSIALDPGLMGLVVPGGKQQAGSGSNIREALLANCARSYPMRQKVLLPLHTWARFAGWFKKYGFFQFGLRDFMINTLDGRQPNAGQDVTTV